MASRDLITRRSRVRIPPRYSRKARNGGLFVFSGGRSRPHRQPAFGSAGRCDHPPEPARQSECPGPARLTGAKVANGAVAGDHVQVGLRRVLYRADRVAAIDIGPEHTRCVCGGARSLQGAGAACRLDIYHHIRRSISASTDHGQPVRKRGNCPVGLSLGRELWLMSSLRGPALPVVPAVPAGRAAPALPLLSWWPEQECPLEPQVGDLVLEALVDRALVARNLRLIGAPARLICAISTARTTTARPTTGPCLKRPTFMIL